HRARQGHGAGGRGRGDRDPPAARGRPSFRLRPRPGLLHPEAAAGSRVPRLVRQRARAPGERALKSLAPPSGLGGGAVVSFRLPRGTPAAVAKIATPRRMAPTAPAFWEERESC